MLLGDVSPSNAQIDTSRQLQFQSMEYRNVGPTRGGRVTSVAGHASQPGTYYMGATGGGVWKTKDYGHAWQNISDGYFHTGSIGAIAVAPSNKQLVYVGTGSDGIRSNVIIGKGMYRSQDAGATWSRIGLSSVGQIGAVLVHPTDENLVYVAAIGNPFKKTDDRGIYRSRDGGTTWDKILFHSDSVGAVDLEFAPDDPTTIYASMWRAERKPWTIISGGHQIGGIYKSTDGGDTWSKLSQGLPQGLIGKSDLAVSAADPNRLWALVEAPQGEGGVFRSDDRGESFALVSTKKELIDRPFYYCNIDVNPQNANSLYVNSTRFWHSTDGGINWTSQSTPHGDNHDMWIHPTDSNLYVQANDGGANVTRDGGQTWSSILNQPTAELYQVAVDDQIPYRLYAGQQDNTTISVPSSPPRPAPGGPPSFWESVGGCETGPAIPKPGNPDIVYSNCKGRFGVYNRKTGQEKQYYVGATNIYGHNPKNLKFRFQRVSPIHVSPHDPDVVYHASQYLHRTTSDGAYWEIISPDLTANPAIGQVISGFPITRDITGEEYYSTIYAVRESVLEPGLIWVGANDGPVHLTRDGGEHWTEVTPPALPKMGRVQCVEPSPHQAGKAYIAVYRYLLGDFAPYIYKTEDYGQTWSRLTDGANGIPGDYPTRVIREDPIREGLLYAGTEFGAFVSLDDGATWQSFQQNLPVTPITDIVIKDDDLVLSTMGRSFWILDDISALRQIPDQASTTLYRPADTYRLRYRGSEDVPEYPAASMVIQYHLAGAPQGNVRMTIRDENGQMIQSFDSRKPTKETAIELSMATGFGNAASSVTLDTTRGSHRLRWNLRHRGFVDDKGKNVRGPMVSPGLYRITLAVDGKTFTEEARVNMDPRLREAGIDLTDLKEQEWLALEVQRLRMQATALAKEIGDQMGEDRAAADRAEHLQEVYDILHTTEGRYHRPKLLAQLSYLASMLDRADQKPGRDAHDRYLELRSLFAEAKALANSGTGVQD